MPGSSASAPISTSCSPRAERGGSAAVPAGRAARRRAARGRASGPERLSRAPTGRSCAPPPGRAATVSGGASSDPLERSRRRDAERCRGCSTRRARHRPGLWAVGFVAYEAAPGFDPALASCVPSGGRAGARGVQPLSPAGRSRPRAGRRPPAAARGLLPGLGEPSTRWRSPPIREAIAAGETYQVNFTFPPAGRLRRRPRSALLAPGTRQRGAVCCLPRLRRARVVSLSPELFFEREGDRLRHAADEGDAPAGSVHRRGRRAGRRARRLGEGPRREPDDRRHGAQRPRADRRAG